jgi:uncharacterized membrane protein YjjP (DUF1212 family)
MNYKLLFKTAMLAGEIMAQSGSEIFRAEDTMFRILKVSGLKEIQVYVTTTLVMATLSDTGMESISEILRINSRENNLNKIDKVNQISRDLCEGKIQIETAYDKLIQLRDGKTYSEVIVGLATIVAAGEFSGIFGGSALDCSIAAMNGLIMVICGRLLTKYLKSPLMLDIAKSFLIALFTLVCTAYLDDTNSKIIIIGSIMPLVPGVPITNAVRDTLQGNYMSGTARIIESFVVSAGIAVGIAFGMGLYSIIERMTIS